MKTGKDMPGTISTSKMLLKKKEKEYLKNNYLVNFEPVRIVLNNL